MVQQQRFRPSVSARLIGAAVAAFAALGSFAADSAWAQSGWEARATADARQRIDEVRTRNNSDARRQYSHDYPGYVTFYMWYGEIDPAGEPARNAWGGGFRFGWAGQIRPLISLDGGTFTSQSFADAQFARLFPLGIEAEFHVPFGTDFGLSFVGGLQAGMSMINYDLEAIKIIQIFAGFDVFVGSRFHFGPAFLGFDFRIGPQFYLHQWDYDEDPLAILPPEPLTRDNWWVGFTFALGVTF